MDSLLDRFERGDPRALARIITRVENRTQDSFDLLRHVFARAGRARIIGITGSPGAGKSTLVDKLASSFRDDGNSLAVVAVDPSSPFTGGAILGDRIRMQSRSLDEGIFIRSMATRGNLGGLAAATADVTTVLDAAGRNPVIVETVGVGQDEIDVVKLADVSVVVLVPGMGDDIQALKAGIMEIGDIFVINKCDRPGVDKMEKAVTAMLSLAHRSDGWEPPIVKTTATNGDGIPELRARLEDCYSFLAASASRRARKHEAARQHLTRLLEERLVHRALTETLPGGELDTVIGQIADRSRDPYSIVEAIVRAVRFERISS